MKIHCVFHNDVNPSMHVYPDNYAYCFVCNRGYRPEGDEPSLPPVKPTEPEDLPASIAFIKSLPKRQHRGLEFYATARGIFILWPNEDYYKFRFDAVPEGLPRYLGAVGHKPPLFWASKQQSDSGRLFIVEGEINALSVAKCFPGSSVLSPGASGMFTQRKAEILKIANDYPDVCVWVDRDPAGVRASWELTELHAQRHRLLSVILSEQDANDKLAMYGKTALHRYVLPYISRSVDTHEMF